MADADLTPLMRQYREIKQAYRDAILFFRVGDFYEMFYEDAETASRILSIALTSRDKTRADPVPLCGVPYHAAMTYIAKLLKAGRTVALCDQVEDPKLAKTLVRREVVRLYTPGTLVDTELLPPTEANFLAAVVQARDRGPVSAHPHFGMAALDPSTGDFWTIEFRGASAQGDLRDELFRVEPRELLYPPELTSFVDAAVAGLKRVRLCPDETTGVELSKAQRLLEEHFGVSSLDGFGCQDLSVGIQAAAAVLQYLRATQPTANLAHLSAVQVRRARHVMHLDAATIRTLELVRPLSEGHRDATLLSVLDKTISSMGGRLLREWILRPLTDPEAISARLDAVADLLEHVAIRTRIRSELGRVHDVARLGSRVSLGAAMPRELLGLKQSLSALPALGTALLDMHAPLLRDLAGSWDTLSDLAQLLEETLLPDPPPTMRDGGIIRDGYHPELDDLRRASREGKHWIAALEAQERERTGIDSLKIRFNQVFGFYIEVTKANASRVPDRYSRKQTLTNAERFTTVELKELEDRVTGAESKRIALEQALFEQIRAQVAKETPRIHLMAGLLASLDVLTTLAEIAALHRYVRPTLDHGDTLQIVHGRHPVVECLEPAGGFVPNDTLLDLETNRLIILTGPNMAGKSTYLRQIALIVLMAQVGSFVPAERAHIGVTDRIFTRVGAGDNLAGGQSTFMVEMTETAQILNCATRRSLILLDEIGRGTSTYDGLSIAWAVAEYIVAPDRLGSRALFATHYHEMTDLARQHQGVKNWTVLVKERDEEVIFLRKILEGAADRSYGIHVARLAGLPGSVIRRAKEVLAQLESATPPQTRDHPFYADAVVADDPTLPSPHPILDEVRQMDLFAMTPLEALNRLAELQRRIDSRA